MVASTDGCLSFLKIGYGKILCLWKTLFFYVSNFSSHLTLLWCLEHLFLYYDSNLHALDGSCILSVSFHIHIFCCPNIPLFFRIFFLNETFDESNPFTVFTLSLSKILLHKL
jgi:hypothetical protein